MRLQTLFLCWKEFTKESLMMRVQQHRAVQHHHQHLLQNYLEKWKKYHQWCIEKMVRRISNLPSKLLRVGSCWCRGAGDVSGERNDSLGQGGL